MTNAELEKEYQKFQVEFSKACKDMSDAINKFVTRKFKTF